MKTLLTLIAILAINFSLFSQVPQRLSYQAVIRNSSGGLVVSHAVGMRISILQGSASGTAVYVETHTTTTNANGLATVQIGGGTVVSGTFATINWASGTYYLKTEADPAGGASYTIVGTSQLFSVPYALHAATVQTGDNWGAQTVNADAANFTGNGSSSSPLKLSSMGASAGQVLKWNGTMWDNALDDTGPWDSDDAYIYNYSAKSFGMGINKPSRKLTIADGGTSCHMNLVNSSTGYNTTDGLQLNMVGLNGWLSNYETGSLSLATSATARLIIESGGDVGIATTNPTRKLDVNGDVNIRGNSSLMLYCNSAEAIWFNNTYFSWGYGGTYNFFGDKVKIGGDGNVAPAYALYVSGNAYATGTWTSSDMRFKKNITTITDPLERLLKIRGTEFEFRSNEFADFAFAQGTQLGFIAQELENVFPELVSTESDGYKSVNYNGMIPVLLEAVKEQHKIIDGVKAENNELKARLEKLEEKFRERF